MIPPPVTVHSLEPTGYTGGRIYLRMVHAALQDVATLHTLPDPKRSYRHRRWRKLRHLAALTPRVRALRHAEGVFVWDDLSVLLFTADMRRRTVFVLHHHDRLHYDSQPVEPLLWKALPAALRECAAVVCVSPYWARRRARHGIRAQVVHNTYDTDVLAAVRAEDRDALRCRFALPDDRLLVYVGKPVSAPATTPSAPAPDT
ncbi:MAG: glycosyltransferase [Pseudonocardia sp.]